MGIEEWTIVETPGSVPALSKAIFSPGEQGSEIIRVAAGSGGSIWAIVRRGDCNGIGLGGSQTMFYRSTDWGIVWHHTPYDNLVAAQSSIDNGTFIWNIAIAPDNPSIIAVACADIQKSPLAQEVWLSTDQGASWRNTQWPPDAIRKGVDLISAIAISVDVDGHTILVGTRDGTGLGTNNLQIMHMATYGVWKAQNGTGEPSSVGLVSGDVLAAKFSPSFFTDRTVVVVYTDGTTKPDHRGTWLATGIYDVLSNSTKWQSRQKHVEIRNRNSNFGDSPRVDEIITANIELPADFSGQDPECRRFYISTDAIDRVEGVTPNRGIYRIDADAVYTLMDNTSTYGSITSSSVTRRISSIAYFGFCKSGKLLAGEVLGEGYKASAPTWFTDLPTDCPPPWYSTLKPVSGSVDQSPPPRFRDEWSYCNVQVAWSSDGTIAYSATAAAQLGPWAIPSVARGAVVSELSWPAGYVNVVPLDESAFSISRNNGETWNQISLIDTAISSLVDVAPAPDSRTLYLASVNLKRRDSSCIVIDSVWRSSCNPAVVSPLPPLPLGTVWERILTHVRPYDCNHEGIESAILRLPEDWPGGHSVFFAPICTNAGISNMENNIIFWSPDYGDYWAFITPEIAIQDVTLPSSTQLYVLAANGGVQRLAYTGTKWAKIDVYNAGISGHMIQAYSDWVIVGSQDTSSVSPAFAYSSDLGKIWKTVSRPTENATGHVHVIFHPNFLHNRDIYAGFDGALGSIYHFNIGTSERWSEVISDVSGMHDRKTGCCGLGIDSTCCALYSAHIPGQEFPINSIVYRLLRPSGSMSGSEILWELLCNFQPSTIAGIAFTREPYSLKLSGCQTLETDTVMFAIDARDYLPTSLRGMLWTYRDKTGKRGIKATTDVITQQMIMTGVTGQPIDLMAELLRAREQLSQITTPVLLTEGKTDVAILEAAWQNLHPGERHSFSIQSCDLLTCGPGVGGAGGADTLKSRLITVPYDSPNKQIGLFDRDREGIRYFALNANFIPFNSREDQKVHKNRKAYAFLVPVPPGMERFEQYHNLPIEFLFEEQYLSKRVDNEGLVLSPKPVIRIVDGVTIDKQEGDSLEFMSIQKDSKKIFAEKVVPTLPPEAFKNFELIFKVVQQMLKD
jgi:hypothetical protein